MARTDVRSLRREQILDVAGRLMGERGWTAVTFAAICREASVSNGVLTYHFTDKEDLLFSLFERQLVRLREEVFIPFQSSDDPLEDRLATLIGHMTRLSLDLGEFRLLILHFLSLAAERPDLAARLRRLRTEQEDVILDRLQRDAAAGIVRRDPAAATLMIQSMFVGLGLLRGVFDIDPAPEDVVAMLHLFLTSDPAGDPAATRDP